MGDIGAETDRTSAHLLSRGQPDTRPVQRVICSQCGARAWLSEGEAQACGDCGGPFRLMGPLEGIVDRLFAPPDQHVAEFYPRHLKLVELMWTANGRGRATYEALALRKVSYTQFVTRATEIVIRGLSEGWIEARIPAAPTMDDSAYEIRFVDPNRWADELVDAFADRLPDETPPVRVDVEGDPDVV